MVFEGLEVNGLIVQVFCRASPVDNQLNHVNQSSSDRLSAANVQLLESMWMLKSPSRRHGADRVE